MPARKFLHAMLHHDYGIHTASICVKSRQYPWPNTPRAGDEWTSFVARAEESNGRLHLHVMRVAEGSAMRHFVVPLRTSSADMRDSVLALARDPQNEDIMEDIYDLLQEDSEMSSAIIDYEAAVHLFDLAEAVGGEWNIS
ncbi:hypothetical protein B0H10DRAFT_1959009 [Mycena sp. CBHHK59/15]|nr:hypothetical protein B0H10DRAFT_1959009 [Mycena sp. CBHHK59/15]